MPSSPIYLKADLTRLSQVFSNFLTNSAKYTPKGGKIEIDVEHHSDQAKVHVHETGIGIPRDSLQHIFDKFSQVDRNAKCATGELGIGLALVEMHWEK